MRVGSTSGWDSGVGVGVGAATTAAIAVAESGLSALATVAKVGSGAPTAITVTVGDGAGWTLLVRDGVGWISSRANSTVLSVPQAARTIASASRAGVAAILLIANAVSTPRSIIMPGELSRSYAAWQGKYAISRRYALPVVT